MPASDSAAAGAGAPVGVGVGAYGGRRSGGGPAGAGAIPAGRLAGWLAGGRDASAAAARLHPGRARTAGLAAALHEPSPPTDPPTHPPRTGVKAAEAQLAGQPLCHHVAHKARGACQLGGRREAGRGCRVQARDAGRVGVGWVGREERKSEHAAASRQAGRYRQGPAPHPAKEQLLGAAPRLTPRCASSQGTCCGKPVQPRGSLRAAAAACRCCRRALPLRRLLLFTARAPLISRRTPQAAAAACSWRREQAPSKAGATGCCCSCCCCCCAGTASATSPSSSPSSSCSSTSSPAAAASELRAGAAAAAPPQPPPPLLLLSSPMGHSSGCPTAATKLPSSASRQAASAAAYRRCSADSGLCRASQQQGKECRWQPRWEQWGGNEGRPARGQQGTAQQRGTATDPSVRAAAASGSSRVESAASGLPRPMRCTAAACPAAAPAAPLPARSALGRQPAGMEGVGGCVMVVVVAMCVWGRCAGMGHQSLSASRRMRKQPAQAAARLVHAARATVAQEAVHAAQVAGRVHHCGDAPCGKVGQLCQTPSRFCEATHTHVRTLLKQSPRTCDAAAALAAQCRRYGPQVVHQPPPQLEAAPGPTRGWAGSQNNRSERAERGGAGRHLGSGGWRRCCRQAPIHAHLNSACRACLTAACGSRNRSSSRTQQLVLLRALAPPLAAVRAAAGRAVPGTSTSASCTSVACGGPPLLPSCVVSSGGHSASMAQHRATPNTSLQQH